MSTVQRSTLNITAMLIAFALVWILAAAMYALARWEIPEKNHDLMVVVVTAITTNVGTVIAFFFGSSVQNKQQADAISAMADTAAKSVSAALPPTADKSIKIDPGQTAEVKATEPTS